MAMDAVIRQMVADTDNEILAEALGVEEHELPLGRSDDIEGGDDFADVEGWDGEPLDPQEIAATNLYGDPDGNGQDRPLQHAEEVGYEAALQAANERIAALEAHSAELMQRADPELQRRLAAQREDAIVQLIANPDQAFEHINQQQAYIRALEEGRANAALAAEHRRSGRAFEAAYSALTSLDSNNPTAKQIVRGILSDPDPGRALMEWYEVAGRRGRQPPFMGGSGGPGARFTRSLNSSQSSGGNVFRQDYEARTDSSEEDDVMAYALGR